MRAGRWRVVDAPEVAPIVAALDARGWGLDQIWITHHHGDHTEGVPDLVARYGAKVVGHGKDKSRLPPLDVEVGEGDRVALGSTEARVIDVSGHTIGHIAFIMDADKAAFTADSLMALGCGARVRGHTRHDVGEPVQVPRPARRHDGLFGPQLREGKRGLCDVGGAGE